MKQILNVYSIFSIIGAMLLNAAPAVAANMTQAPPGGLDVHVVNPPTDPVPVAISEPVAVTIEGQAAPVPFQENGRDDRNNTNLVAIEFSTVPADSRLMIQDVAGRIAVVQPNTNLPLPRVNECELLIINSNFGGSFSRFIPTGGPFVDVNDNGDPLDIEMISEPVVVVAEAGQHPLLRCDFVDLAETLSFRASLAGILVHVEE